VDYAALNFWLHGLEFVLLGVIGIHGWVVSRDRVTRAAINRVDEKVDKLDKRVAERVDTLEDRVLVIEQQIPSDEKWRELYTRLGTAEQKMSALTEKLEATDNLLDTVHQHLLDQGK
jgi:hypothetical protein